MSSPTLRLTGAQALVKLLQAEGVQHAFGIEIGRASCRERV